MDSEQYKLVVELLQRRDVDAARAAALRIQCDTLREQALVLIERTRPIQPRVA
jgi:hypothetical protein